MTIDRAGKRRLGTVVSGTAMVGAMILGRSGLGQQGHSFIGGLPG
jgi:hypothetical protein